MDVLESTALGGEDEGSFTTECNFFLPRCFIRRLQSSDISQTWTQTLTHT